MPVLPLLDVLEESGQVELWFWKHCELSQHQMSPAGAALQVF